MRLSDSIVDIFAERDRVVTFEDFLDSIDEKSYGILFAILALPSAMPLPAPGYSTPFGIMLLVLSLQYSFGRQYPWFPARVRRMKLKSRGKSSGRFQRAATKFLRFVEKFLKPRWSGMYKGGRPRLIFGIGLCLCSISLILPVPLTNTVPAMGVLLIGLGLLEEDALFGLVGLVVGVAGLLLTTAVLYYSIRFGAAGIDQLKQALGR